MDSFFLVPAAVIACMENQDHYHRAQITSRTWDTVNQYCIL